MKDQNPALVPTELFEQIKLASWLTKNNILHFAVPNGGKRHLIEAIKFKRSGVQSGVPDIVVPIATKRYHGLFLELKRRKGGRVSDTQLYWLAELRKQGYCAEIAYGADQAIQIVLDYLGRSQPECPTVVCVA